MGHGRQRGGPAMEALMASKDKGGKNVKKTAAKSLKQKRLDKKGTEASKGDQVGRL